MENKINEELRSADSDSDEEESDVDRMLVETKEFSDMEEDSEASEDESTEEEEKEETSKDSSSEEAELESVEEKEKEATSKRNRKSRQTSSKAKGGGMAKASEKTKQGEQYNEEKRKEKNDRVKGKSKQGLAPGFDPDPSSEEPDCDSAEEERKKPTSKRNTKSRKTSSKAKGGGKATASEKTKQASAEPEWESPEKEEKGAPSKRNTTSRETSSKAKSNGKARASEKTKQGEQRSEEGSGSDDEVEDDDSVDFGDTKVIKNLAKQMKEESKFLFPVFVSPPFHNVVDDTAVWAIFFGKPNKTFYCKAPHQKAICKMVHHLRLSGTSRNVPNWIDTIVDVKICKKEHGQPSVWYKSKKGNTTEIVHFVVSLPENESEKFHDMLSGIMKDFFVKGFKKRHKNPAGQLALAYAEEQGDNSDLDKGLYNWCVRVKEGKDPLLAASAMTKEIHDHFSGGPAFHYDVSLDKFMIDWDVKHFLQDHVGVNSWDDLDEAGRKACYRDFPKRHLPGWDTIIAENY